MLPDPFALFSHLTRRVEGLHELERVRRGAWLLANTPRPPVGLSPFEVIHRQASLQVKFYAPAADSQRTPTPVVLVPSLINRAYVLDLEPGRSLIEALTRWAFALK